MTHEKILKLIMAHGRIKHSDVTNKLKRMNIGSPYFTRIYRKEVTFAQFLRVLDLLNYELVFKPKGSNLPEYSYRITWEDYKDKSDE